jgi:starch-binding outer membrane protein, SusD/RagB family
MHIRQGRGRVLPLVRLAILACVPVLAACDLDTILEARDPFTVTPGTARDTANLETLYAGARAQFALAYAGQTNTEGGIVMMSGLMSDELYASDNFGTRQAVDRRQINYDISNAASDHAFLYLQRARAEALNAIDLYQQSPRSGNDRHSELFSVAGYSVVLLAENFCAGIPLSRITETGTEFGQPRSRVELFEMAIGYFDEALAQPNATAREQNLARVGKARALLNLGRFAEAAQAAANVPAAFVFAIEYSAGSFFTPNAIFNMNNEERRFSVSLQEGTANRGLPFGTVAPADPRINISPTPVESNSGAVPAWLQLKYPSQSAAVPLASGLEARLIQAEAQLNMGTSAAYLATLNALRSEVGLGALTDPGSAAGRVDQFFAERAYFLWLTGHRLSDMRRLVRQYGRDQATVFPTGLTEYGQEYGTAVSLPIPFEEVNNPNYSTCTDRGA